MALAPETLLYLGLAGSALIVLADDLRLVILGLLLQYVCGASFTAPTLGTGVAFIKVLGGAIAALVLWLGLPQDPDQISSRRGLVGRFSFRVAALTLVMIGAWGVTRAGWFMGTISSPEARLLSLEFLAIGLLLMGLHLEPLKVGLGVLTFLSGFEILYSLIEPSLAIVALLVSVHIGIAIAVGYLGVRERSGRSGGGEQAT